MRRFGIGAGILLVLALVGVGAWTFAINWNPPRKDYAIQGIDVSDDDGAIDWFAVKAQDVNFAYARATVGVDTRDVRFADFWAGMAEAGVRRGAIHVFSLCRLAADQAATFVAVVPRDTDALPAAIDLDFHDDCPARPEREIVLGEIRQIAATIETHSGKPVILRIAPAFEAKYGVSGTIPRSLWSTGSFFAPHYLARPWRMWQSSRIHRIEGIERAVNWNVVAP